MRKKLKRRAPSRDLKEGIMAHTGIRTKHAGVLACGAHDTNDPKYCGDEGVRT